MSQRFSRFHRQNRIEEQYARRSPIGKIASRATYFIRRSYYFENIFSRKAAVFLLLAQKKLTHKPYRACDTDPGRK